MSPASAIFLLLALGLAAATAATYVRAPLSRPRRIALASLRLLALLLLVLAFVQPTCDFRRVDLRAPRLLVLVDNSQSMQLFSADSVMRALAAALARSRGPASGKALDVDYAAFGDSTRRPVAPAGLDFGDARSYFPASLNASGGPTPSRMLIVSDGNWSNASIPQSLHGDLPVYYLVLPPAQRRAYLDASMLSNRVETVAGDSARVPLRLSGYSPRHARVTLAGARTRAAPSFAVDSGFFSDTTSVVLAGTSPGRHLRRIRLTDQTGALSATCHAVQTVIPRAFRVRLHTALPRLDARFLSLALQADSLWRLLGAQDTAQADALALFDWDAKAQALLAALPSTGAALFAGVSAQQGCSKVDIRRYTVVLQGDAAVALGRTNLEQLPPLEQALFCPGAVSAAATRLVSLIPLDRGAPADTVPLLWTTRVFGRSATVVAARRLWELDFLPQAFGTVTEGDQPFMRLTLSTVRQALIANLSSELLVYPTHVPLSATRPISMGIVCPATLNASEPAQFRLTLRSPAGALRVDTLMNVAADPALTQNITLPALDSGAYVLAASVWQGRATFSCHDTVLVQGDDTELRVAAQNTMLLGQVALPFDMRDSAAAKSLLTTPNAGAAQRTIVQTFAIRQTWYLLALTLLLFAGEWYLRKRWKLD